MYDCVVRYDLIDDVLGIERYNEEIPPKAHFYAYGSVGGGGDACAGDRRMPLGLHVDTNSVGTYATSILYVHAPSSPNPLAVCCCVRARVIFPLKLGQYTTTMLVS